jgi:hypothetical protein
MDEIIIRIIKNYKKDRIFNNNKLIKYNKQERILNMYKISKI